MPVLPAGWIEKFSASQSRNYYVNDAGKRQWHVPLEKTEKDKLAIKKYYLDNDIKTPPFLNGLLENSSRKSKSKLNQ
jgi:hypothetical protein